MRRALCLCLLWIGLHAVASAESRSHGYLFIAPGGVSGGGASAMTMHLGAGGDFLLAKGIGIGIEAGAIGLRQDYVGTIFGLGSVNGSYHFPAGHKIDPFVTAGYSIGFRSFRSFRSDRQNFFNVGAGVNYWFLSRLGLKLEIRDHVARGFGATDHFWGVRFGLAF